MPGPDGVAAEDSAGTTPGPAPGSLDVTAPVASQP